jgi:hypothetical protein
MLAIRSTPVRETERQRERVREGGSEGDRDSQEAHLTDLTEAMHLVSHLRDESQLSCQRCNLRFQRHDPRSVLRLEIVITSSNLLFELQDM